MIFYDEGKEYWAIVSRVRRNDNRPMVVRAAISDLNRLIASTKSDAVRKRALHWIALHQKYSPGNNDGGSGPRYA